MKATADSIVAAIPRRRLRLADYMELTKPRLNFLVLVTTLTGFYMGSQGVFNVVLMIHTLFGTALVAASASILNQYVEREDDAKMHRTQDHPLPSGRVQPHEALWLGVWTAFVGTAYLAIATNLLAALLAGFTWYSYLCLYTPLKTKTAWNTVVGAVPGAIPPVIGWVAARNQLSWEALVLFGILFLWQFPHFLAIAWMYREDYARGGFQMLSVVDETGARTGRWMTAATIALVFVSLFLVVIGAAGALYCAGAAMLGAGLLYCSLRCTRSGVQNHARRLFLASVFYLPLLLALMTLSKV